MKNFIIGLVIGIILGGNGAYTYCKQKIEKPATKENVEKVVSASKSFCKTIKEIFE
jgi:hypothetical protein